MSESNASRTPEELEYEIIALTRRLKSQRPALSPSMEGLTTMEIHALMMLFRATDECRSIKPSDIAHRFRVSPSAVSQFLKRLEQKGYITRTRAEGDSRSVRISLTEKGHSLSGELRRERAENFVKLVDKVGVEEMNQFVVTLAKICDCIEESSAFVPASHSCGVPGKGQPCA